MSTQQTVDDALNALMAASAGLATVVPAVSPLPIVLAVLKAAIDAVEAITSQPEIASQAAVVAADAAADVIEDAKFGPRGNNP